MKRLSYLAALFVLITTPAMAEYSDKLFRAEIKEGLDLVGARINVDLPDPAPGELGLDVYQTADAGSTSGLKVYIPTSMSISMISFILNCSIF